ncbi:hypothetical protein [Lysinibacter sp. HNR]|uniref:hypothetical protein n=1 Tax=Lysinibacter sp. HNR TaxID=3031408 RepID=UPI0024355011|nr:hypothetical protein [Lysinibacter sp. HNR]WGD38523.1 hypothetical protein FrondiHNR_06345 [Lysinibacter sp. HNR]
MLTGPVTVPGVERLREIMASGMTAKMLGIRWVNTSSLVNALEVGGVLSDLWAVRSEQAGSGQGAT